MAITMRRKNDAVIAAMDSISSGWEQHFLLVSDVHFDNKHCDRKLLKRHFDEAVAKDARIFIFGDFFDCMGGKYDHRSTKADIRPEYQRSDYFDALVEDAAKWLEPYKGHIALISDGNHETSVTLRHEINLLDRLAEKLGGVERGKYSGFVRFKFDRVSQRSSKILYYSHGSGGNSPVTLGVIASNRRQEMIHADYFVTGHLHSEWEVPRTQTRLNEQNNIEVHKCFHWQLGTYEQTHMEGGWADHKGFRGASIGGRWLKFHYVNHQIKVQSWLAD